MENDAEVRSFHGCKHKSDTCVLKDDLTEVLDAARNADILVMASPVFYGDVSAQLKAFIILISASAVSAAKSVIRSRRSSHF